uniref:SRCR domain-containing protein n=1 Tax=Oreochromis niloticus TaxID=8128 RepID=I3KNY0_ORENI
MDSLLFSTGVQSIGTHSSADPDVRVVGGASRCAGTVEVKNMGEWRAVHGIDWTLRQAAVFCKHLGCGSAISVGNSWVSERTPVWELIRDCVQSAFALRECATSSSSVDTLDLTCSESVRLMNGTSLCSGRLEVKSDQSNQSWSSVCEADFDQQDAEVVCRELGCGPPSVVQGGLYGEMGSPLWSKEFHCGGHESALMECKKSGSVKSSCSRNKVVGLICSEPVKMEGGPNRCAGNLKVKQGDWKKVDGFFFTLKEAAIVCQYLDCGSALNIDITRSSDSSGCSIDFDCVKSGFSLKECAVSLESDPYFSLKLTCSDSVRLQNGANLCSGRLEVNNQFNQSWSSVCEADFDQLDAEVVCRELGCGSPSVLQGRGYVEEETTVWSKEFKCGGHEPALLDCRSTESARTNCSSGKVVGLTCSDPDDVRLVDGASHCTGKLEVNHLGEWKPMYGSSWTLKETAVICDRLGCGSAVSAIEGMENFPRSWWEIDSECFMSGSALRECLKPRYNAYLMYLTCSDSVRLMNGTSLCSGRLEVKSDQPNPSWSSVCEADFDLQAAEVVCRELGCGSPSVVQGGLYGEEETPVWSKEFQCEGHESALLDCRSSDSTRSSCSPGKAVGLTCSEPVRMVGGASRCADETALSIRVVVLPLILLLENIVLYFYWKARRGRMLSRQETSGQIDSDLIVCASPEGQNETSTSV